MHNDLNQAILIILSLILTVFVVLAIYYFIILKSGETQRSQEPIVTPTSHSNTTKEPVGS